MFNLSCFTRVKAHAHVFIDTTKDVKRILTRKSQFKQ